MKQISRSPILWGLFIAMCAINSAFTASLHESKDQMLKDWERAKEYSKSYLDAMPESGLGFKPTPEIRSFAEQMLHIASANFGIVSSATGVANPYMGKNLEKMDELKNKTALIKIVLNSYDYVIDVISGMSEAQLNQSVHIFGKEMSRETAINKAFEHQTHQIGQTTIYLRLKGITPPAEKLF
jgi:uncharacterized damage-inducible protein DinB